MHAVVTIGWAVVGALVVSAFAGVVVAAAVVIVRNAFRR